MADDPDTNDTAPVVRELPDIVGSAAGAAFGLIVAGPSGAIAGAASGPAVAAALRYGADALHARRQRAGRAMQLAADQLGVTPDALGQRAIEAPARLELLARVLEAAGRTPLEEKVRALGRVLAQGLDDDTAVDEALLLATALDRIEAPHIQVLQQLTGWTMEGDPGWRNTGGQALGHISATLPGSRTMLTALLETLRGQGLVEEVGIPPREEKASVGVTRHAAKPRWRPTDLGERCMQLLSGT